MKEANVARKTKDQPSIETTDGFLIGYQARQQGQPDEPPFPVVQADQRRAWLAGWKQRDAEEQPRDKGQHDRRPAEWHEGYDAAKAGEDAATNCYAPSSPKGKLWLAGWQHATDETKPAAPQQTEYTLSDKDRVAGLNARGIDITVDQWRRLPDESLRTASRWLDDALAGKETPLPVCLLEFSPAHKATVEREISAADPIEIPVEFGGFSCPGDSASIGIRIPKTVADYAAMEKTFCGKRLKAILSPADPQQQLPGLEEGPGEVHGIFESKGWASKPKHFAATLNVKCEGTIADQLLHYANVKGKLRILEVGSIPGKTDKADKPAKNPPPPKRGPKKSGKNAADPPRQKSLGSIDGTPAKPAAKPAAPTLRYYCSRCETVGPAADTTLEACACGQPVAELTVVGHHGEPRAFEDGSLYVLHNEMFSVPIRPDANYRMMISVVRAEGGERRWHAGYVAEWKEPGLDGWERESVEPTINIPGRATQADAIAAAVGEEIDNLSKADGNAFDLAIADLKTYLAEIERGTHPSALEPADESGDDEVAA